MLRCGVWVPAFAATELVWIFQAKSFRLFVIGEQLGISSPGYDRLERFVGRALAHIVLELVAEARLGRGMRGPLVQHALDQADDRHVVSHMLGEQLFARVGLHRRKTLSRDRKS